MAKETEFKLTKEWLDHHMAIAYAINPCMTFHQFVKIVIKTLEETKKRTYTKKEIVNIMLSTKEE